MVEQHSNRVVTPASLNQSDWQFPRFQAREFTPKHSKYCVCVFVINEGEKIRKQLREMKPYTKTLDVIVADGGSTDGSLTDDILQASNVRTLLTKEGPGKLSAQMRMAFAYALSEGYAGVIVIDGNGKDDVTALPHFVEALEAGYDHIQGSRFIPGGKAVNTPLSRLVGLKLIHAPLISLAAHHRHTDTTNGFRGYNAKLLKDPKLAIFRDVFSQYELHYFLSIEAPRQGYRTTEIPVTRTYPKGKAPTKISPLKGNWLITKTLLKAVLGRFRLRKGER